MSSVQIAPVLACALLLLGCADEGELPSSFGGMGGGGGSGGMSSGGMGGMQSGGMGGMSGTGGMSSGGTGGMGGSGGMSSGGVGGGGSGGSAPDSGAPDASTSGSGCDSGDYIVCEDFESGDIPSGWEKHGDPVSVETDDAVSGTHALKLGAIDAGERRIYRVYDDMNELPGTHWGRVRYKVALPVPDAFVHSTLVTLFGESPADDHAQLEVRVVDTVKEQIEGFNNDGNGNHHQFLYNVQPQSRGEFGKGSSYAFMFDGQWHCTEWYIDHEQQAYRFFFDGEEVEDIAIMNGPGNYDETEMPSAYQQIRLGWNNYQAAPPGFTAWLDDFAIASGRVGCE